MVKLGAVSCGRDFMDVGSAPAHSSSEPNIQCVCACFDRKATFMYRALHARRACAPQRDTASYRQHCTHFKTSRYFVQHSTSGTLRPFTCAYDFTTVFQ